jgi:hypothetical protein
MSLRAHTLNAFLRTTTTPLPPLPPTHTHPHTCTHPHPPPPTHTPSSDRAHAPNVVCRYYFKNHQTRETTWVDPRTAAVRKKDAKECGEDELPYGWDEAEINGEVCVAPHVLDLASMRLTRRLSPHSAIDRSLCVPCCTLISIHRRPQVTHAHHNCPVVHSASSAASIAHSHRCSLPTSTHNRAPLYKRSAQS